MATRGSGRSRETKRCDAGDCYAKCPGGCGCIADADNPMDCYCTCYALPRRPKIVTGKKIVVGGKIPFKKFKPGIKITPQTKFNICTKDLPIGALAEFLDKTLPNKILVPASIATSTVTLRLKNKTFKQLIDHTGLAVKR